MDWIYWDRRVIGPVVIRAEEINGLVILRGREVIGLVTLGDEPGFQ